MNKNVTIIPAKYPEQSITRQKTLIRVAAYCRVSTDQEKQLGSFENQVSYYTELIHKTPDWEMAGIFADEGISGTGSKKRPGFQDMIRACHEGKVDRVITKSISRFARNTADCLFYCRDLRNLGIPIYFEKENIDTMKASGEMLLTILSSFAQQESQNISENTRWGIRARFRQGIPQINTNHFLGYDKDPDRNLVVNPEEAKIVRRIFREFLEGWSIEEIAHRLTKDRVPGALGNVQWHRVTIERMLRNEKYKGDLLMQKMYTIDFLTRKMVQNDGGMPQYLIEQNHEPIVSKEDWETVQLELVRRQEYMERHGLQKISTMTGTGFLNRVFCALCGCRLRRMNTKAFNPVWKCVNADRAHGHACRASLIHEADLRKAFVLAWNSLVKNRETELQRWEDMTVSENPLTRVWGKQMLDLTKEGILEFEIEEHTRIVLEEVVVEDPGCFTVKFLDGSIRQICL